MNPFNMSSQIRPEMRQAYQTLTTSKDPMQLLMQMSQSNPNLQPVVQALQNGANPQQLFYQLCSSRGVNPQDILEQLK